MIATSERNEKYITDVNVDKTQAMFITFSLLYSLIASVLLNEFVSFANLHTKSRINIISTLLKLVITEFASVEVDFRSELANFFATFVRRTRSIAKIAIWASASFCNSYSPDGYEHREFWIHFGLMVVQWNIWHISVERWASWRRNMPGTIKCAFRQQHASLSNAGCVLNRKGTRPCNRHRREPTMMLFLGTDMTRAHQGQGSPTYSFEKMKRPDSWAQARPISCAWCDTKKVSSDNHNQLKEYPLGSVQCRR